MEDPKETGGVLPGFMSIPHEAMTQPKVRDAQKQNVRQCYIWVPEGQCQQRSSSLQTLEGLNLHPSVLSPRIHCLSGAATSSVVLVEAPQIGLRRVDRSARRSD